MAVLLKATTLALTLSSCAADEQREESPDEGDGGPVAVIVTLSWLTFLGVVGLFCARRQCMRKFSANQKEQARTLALDLRRGPIEGIFFNGIKCNRQSFQTMEDWLSSPPHNGSIESFLGLLQQWEMTHTSGEPHGRGGGEDEEVEMSTYRELEIKQGHITIEAASYVRTNEYTIRGSGHDKQGGPFTVEGRLDFSVGVLVWTETYTQEAFTASTFANSDHHPCCLWARNGQKLQVVALLVIVDPNTIVGRYAPNTAENPGGFTLRRPGTSYPQMLDVRLPQTLGSSPTIVTIGAPSLTRMQVTIPEGVGPGQTLTLHAPDGRQVQLEVPAGTTAGQTIQFQF